MINETVDFVNINTGSYGHAPGKPFNTTSTTIDDLVRLIENSKTISDRNSNKQSLHNIIDKNKEYHFYIDLDKNTSLGFNNICSQIFKYFNSPPAYPPEDEIRLSLLRMLDIDSPIPAASDE